MRAIAIRANRRRLSAKMPVPLSTSAHPGARQIGRHRATQDLPLRAGKNAIPMRDVGFDAAAPHRLPIITNIGEAPRSIEPCIGRAARDAADRVPTIGSTKASITLMHQKIALIWPANYLQCLEKFPVSSLGNLECKPLIYHASLRVSIGVRVSFPVFFPVTRESGFQRRVRSRLPPPAESRQTFGS